MDAALVGVLSHTKLAVVIIVGPVLCLHDILIYAHCRGRTLALGR